MPAQIPVRVTYSGSDATGLAELAAGDYIEATLGGTGQSVYVAGDILYASAPTTLARLAKGTLGQVLTMGASFPQWGGNASFGGNVTVTGALTLLYTDTNLPGGFNLNVGGPGVANVRFYGDTNYAAIRSGALSILVQSNSTSTLGTFYNSGVLAWGTTVTTSASAGDVVLANAKSLRAVIAAGTDTYSLISLDINNLTTLNMNSSVLKLQNASTFSAAGAAGGGSALPATPIGYWRVNIAGTVVKIPYYTD